MRLRFTHDLPRLALRARTKDRDKVARDEILDNDLSIRFKHGNHTIFLFVDATKPLSDAAAELLEILQERYPDGLNTSAAPPKKTPLPENPGRIEFAVPKDRLDPSKGWKPLGPLQGADTAAAKGIKDGSIVAFAIRPEDEDDEEELAFEVDFPGYDDEDYAEGS